MGLNLTEILTKWLADPINRNWHLVFCMCVMVVPMLLLSIWYHWTIRRTGRGKKLMKRQTEAGTWTLGSLEEGSSMTRDIASGKYGAHAKKLQNKVYWVVGFWVVVCAIAFGILIAADEMNRPLEP